MLCCKNQYMHTGPEIECTEVGLIVDRPSLELPSGLKLSASCVRYLLGRAFNAQLSQSTSMSGLVMQGQKCVWKREHGNRAWIGKASSRRTRSMTTSRFLFLVGWHRPGTNIRSERWNDADRAIAQFCREFDTCKGRFLFNSAPGLAASWTLRWELVLVETLESEQPEFRSTLGSQ